MTFALWAIGLGAIAWFSLRRPASARTQAQEKRIPSWLYWLLVVVLAFAAALLLRFGFHWLVVGGGLLATAARRALPLLRWAPWASRFVAGSNRRKGWTASQTSSEGRSRESQGRWGAPGASRSSGMTQDEALAVLGLRRGATREEIEREYRRLIAKVHPDRGGSNYLASKLNEAREVLL